MIVCKWKLFNSFASVECSLYSLMLATNNSDFSSWLLNFQHTPTTCLRFISKPWSPCTWSRKKSWSRWGTFCSCQCTVLSVKTCISNYMIGLFSKKKKKGLELGNFTVLVWSRLFCSYFELQFIKIHFVQNKSY